MIATKRLGKSNIPGLTPEMVNALFFLHDAYRAEKVVVAASDGNPLTEDVKEKIPNKKSFGPRRDIIGHC